MSIEHILYIENHNCAKTLILDVFVENKNRKRLKNLILRVRNIVFLVAEFFDFSTLARKSKKNLVNLR